MISVSRVLKTSLIPIIALLFLTGCKPPDTRERFVVNTTIIGSYELASGKVRVLYRKDNGDKYLDEANDFHVQMFGSRAY